MAESSPKNHQQTSLASLLRNNLLASALIFALLECWRPYFFLTDDNLDGMYPFLMEVGNHLLHGQSPFYSSHLFGAHYEYLRDPAYFDWHPQFLLSSLLAGTPWRCAIVEVNAFVFLMLATAGFVTLGHHVRREMSVALSNGWIMFYALSFTYSMIALTTGASWLTFLGNMSAMPWLALGILQRTWRWGIGLVALASLHQLLGGHLSPTVSTSVFFSLFAIGMSVSQKSIRPLANWLVGYTVAVVVVLPLLVPMIEGFSSSLRAQGTTLEDMQSYKIPFRLFPTTFFAGMCIWIFSRVDDVGPTHETYTVALGACAAAWCLIPALLNRARWRGPEIVIFGIMLFGVFMVCRPAWVAEIMRHLPLLRSLRWPFRELLQFQFFFHFFLLVRRPGRLELIQKYAAGFGTCLYAIPLFLYSLPPTFNAMDWDRELIIKGGFERYWSQVRPLLKPDDRVAVIIPFHIYRQDRYEEPYSLLGSYNYATMAGFVNSSGYSPTAPLDQLDVKLYAFYPFGAYLPEQKADLLKHRPDLKFITLESLHPLRITLSSGEEVIDLTPFVPTRTGSP